MLIINGTAEFMPTEGNYVQGDRYDFNMFVKNDNLDDELNNIEAYLVANGWDNIKITESGLMENIEDIQHSVLISAFKKAQDKGLSVVIHNRAT